MTFNATMDVAAAKELIGNTIAASKELGVNREKIPVWEKMLAKMPAYLVNEDGAVREWLTPKLADNYNHRHNSQLYALFDGMPDEIARDAKLKAAFRRLIELKLERHWSNWQRQGGFMSFGLVQLGQASASLGEADLAYRCLVPLLNRYWLHNLASTHNAKQLFNMDISGGLPSVVIKMLVSSDPGIVRLLPACPSAWPSGTIEGVLCRGQVEVRRLSWDGRTISAVLKSAKAQSVSLFTPAEIASLRVSGGGDAATAPKDPRGRRLSLPAGREVQIEIVMK
jgi:hypothetical protein